MLWLVGCGNPSVKPQCIFKLPVPERVPASCNLHRKESFLRSCSCGRHTHPYKQQWRHRIFFLLKLSQSFDYTDNGPLRLFLGMDIICCSEGIYIHQWTYILELPTLLWTSKLQAYQYFATPLLFTFLSDSFFHLSTPLRSFHSSRKIMQAQDLKWNAAGEAMCFSTIWWRFEESKKTLCQLFNQGSALILPLWRPRY